ncbi:MAG: ComF family protein [Clostridia bacterium]|nr:ComF family protein [Clostridia bacterium]
MDRKEFLERFIFVRKCGGCGEILPYERSRQAFCSDCERAWLVAKAENCSECLRVVTECTCTPKGLRGVFSLRKLIFYHPKKVKEPQNQMIYRIKHRPNKRISEFVASELSAAVEEEICACGFSERRQDVVIVNLPRGRRAKTLYGFDQSALICRALSEKTGIAYVEAIGRRRGGREQKTLTGARRFVNVKGLFYVRDERAIAGKCILLVDDIVTTGASMSGCVKLLAQAGAKEILAFCIAQD